MIAGRSHPVLRPRHHVSVAFADMLAGLPRSLRRLDRIFRGELHLTADAQGVLTARLALRLPKQPTVYLPARNLAAAADAVVKLAVSFVAVTARESRLAMPSSITLDGDGARLVKAHREQQRRDAKAATAARVRAIEAEAAARAAKARPAAPPPPTPAQQEAALVAEIATLVHQHRPARRAP